MMRPRFLGEPGPPIEEQEELRFLEALRQALLRVIALAANGRSPGKYRLEVRLRPKTSSEEA